MGTHRYGIRLKDNVSATQIVSNTIEHSERFGIFVYNHANNNLFQHNPTYFSAVQRTALCTTNSTTVATGESIVTETLFA